VTIKRQLHDQTRDLLVDLGTSRAEVADALRDLGVVATPKDPQDCAIAVYLKAILGTERRVRSLAVKCNCVMVFLDEAKRFHWRSVVTIELPEPVGEFVVAFDQGAYPELTRKGSRAPSRYSSNII